MGKNINCNDAEKNVSLISNANLGNAYFLDEPTRANGVENQAPNSTSFVSACNGADNGEAMKSENDSTFAESININSKELENNFTNATKPNLIATVSSNETDTSKLKNDFKLRIVPLEKLLEKPEKLKDHLKPPTPPLLVIDSDSDSNIENLLEKSKEKVNAPSRKSKVIRTIQKRKSPIKESARLKEKYNLKNKCKKLKIKIKRLSSEEINAATTSIGTTRKSKLFVKHNQTNKKKTDSKVTRNSKMAEKDEEPTTSARARALQNMVCNDEYESEWERKNKNRKKSVSPDSYSSGDDSENNDNDDNDSSSKSSDSEILPVRKKRTFSKRKNSTDDSDFEPFNKKKKQRRILRNTSSDGTQSSGSDDENEGKNKKRKHIRKIIKTADLDVSTKTAAKEEEERRKRIEERQKVYNQIYEKPESTEVSELVLDFDENSKKPLLEVDKGLLKKLKPHQVTGVKFMWDACFETLNDCNNKPGSGCILAHCMGLGKTLQIVTLSHTLLSNSSKTGIERVLIISPLSTLNNWAREYKMWMNYARKKNIEIYDMSKYRDKNTRIFKLNEWFLEGGVCILGYDLYRILSNEKAKGLRKKQRESLQNSLVDPGPDMVVCDEGHLLKNEKTSISKAVTRMRTKRRIVLTGTPLQNNLKEYYCMIQFIKPNLLGTYKEYMNRFVNPITNGQYTDSTERDIRLMKHRAHILHKMLEGCIQRRDYSVLAPYLPPKHEYVVYTTLSPLQQQLYEYYMTTQRDLISSDLSGKGARLFQDFQDLRRIWTHPMCLRVNSDIVIRKRLLAHEDDSLEDFICDDDDDAGSTSTPCSSDDESIDSSKSLASGGASNKKTAIKKRKTRNNKNTDNGDDDSDVEHIQENQNAENDDPSEWWKKFVQNKDLNDIHHSPKMMILMRLLQECESIGDKLLVFSQSLQSLEVIEHFLALIDNKTKGHDCNDIDVADFKGRWTPGLDYFRLDGSCSVESREVMCKKFNDTSNLRARLFLISTRAGGLGINLVAANRVVIFDVSWNPSHDTQSIFRVYRFGQDKPCYIYRLIAMGTMEQKVYERQVAKQATAKRVIDEQQISRHYNQSDLLELYTYELKTNFEEREIPILPKDRLFAELLSEQDKLIFKYHEHDSLLENEESENLSESERKAAWSEYEAEKTRSVQTAQYMSYDRGAFGGQYGNASGSVTSNKIFGFRSDVLLQLLNMKVASDHPEYTQNQVLQAVPGYLNTLYNEMNGGDPTMYKDLLILHQTLERPGGMYMSPLLYVNQNPSAAGYYQSPTAGQIPPSTTQPVSSAPRFDPNQIIELD